MADLPLPPPAPRTAFLVVSTTAGGDYWLRGTVWSYSEERAEAFASRDAAIDALHGAKKFTKAAAYRAARIIETVR